MQVRNIRWVGVPTRDYDTMVGFLGEALALRVNFSEPTTTEFSTSEGDEIQVMAPGDAYYNFFTEHAAGPVPLFEVDDVHRAPGTRGGGHRGHRGDRPRQPVGVDSLPRARRQPV